MTWQDKAFHFAGAFTVVVLLDRFLPTGAAAIIAVIACGGLEVYQARFKPHYIGKELDTALDLIADAAGILVAFWR